MSRVREDWIDERLEQLMGNLLRTGVLLAAAVVTIGGVVYLRRHATEPAGHHTFRGEPQDLRTVNGIIDDALALRGRGLIQLGLLLLIATPVARVAFSLLAFAIERDWVYLVVTAVVLTVLIFSLCFANPGA
jgi:uncharacterized membrane protein